MLTNRTPASPQQQNAGIEAPFTYVAEWFYKKYQNAAQRA